MTNFTQFILYFINGLIATIAHFSVLMLLVEVADFESAGMANAIASVFGICSSFVGNRYLVFCGVRRNLINQFISFSGLYVLIALLNGVILMFLTDWIGIDYKISFLFATFIQVIFGFFGNKFLVFRI